MKEPNENIAVTTADPVRRSKVANHLCDIAKSIDPGARCVILPWRDKSTIVFTASSPEIEGKIRQAMKTALETEDELVFEPDPQEHIHPRFRTPKRDR